MERKYILFGGLLSLVSLTALVGLYSYWQHENNRCGSVSEYTKLSQLLDEPVDEPGRDPKIELAPAGTTYTNEQHGFSLVIPKNWKSFRGINVETGESDIKYVHFLFETTDSRYFNDYNCQGKCQSMFVIGIADHSEFNSFDEFWNNTTKKPDVIHVNERSVYYDAGESNDPPPDLSFVEGERIKVYQSLESFEPIQ